MTEEQIEYLKALAEKLQISADNAAKQAEFLQLQANSIRDFIETQGTRVVTN